MALLVARKRVAGTTTAHLDALGLEARLAGLKMGDSRIESLTYLMPQGRSWKLSR
jgi:hypothetical protein